MKELNITIEIWRKGNTYLASSPELDFISQGATFEDAKKNLLEVIEIQFEEMTEMGTLDDYLLECGFLVEGNNSCPSRCIPHPLRDSRGCAFGYGCESRTPKQCLPHPLAHGTDKGTRSNPVPRSWLEKGGQLIGRCPYLNKGVNAMHNEFTAIIERDGDWFIAYCPEIPGANGQGKTKDECLNNLSQAIDLILEDRREDALRGIPADASREMVSVG